MSIKYKTRPIEAILEILSVMCDLLLKRQEIDNEISKNAAITMENKILVRLNLDFLFDKHFHTTIHMIITSWVENLFKWGFGL